MNTTPGRTTWLHTACVLAALSIADGGVGHRSAGTRHVNRQAAERVDRRRLSGRDGRLALGSPTLPTSSIRARPTTRATCASARCPASRSWRRQTSLAAEPAIRSHQHRPMCRCCGSVWHCPPPEDRRARRDPPRLCTDTPSNPRSARHDAGIAVADDHGRPDGVLFRRHRRRVRSAASRSSRRRTVQGRHLLHQRRQLGTRRMLLRPPQRHDLRFGTRPCA